MYAVELPDGLLQLVSVEEVRPGGVVGGGGGGRLRRGGASLRAVETLFGRIFSFLARIEATHPLKKISESNRSTI